MALILENTAVANGIYKMRLQNAPCGNAGQFVMLREEGVYDPLLPRPISIYNCSESGKTLTLLYQVVGKGTRRMAAMIPGQLLSLTGPHGTGFPLLAGDAALVGGGIGIAPLLLLAKQLRQADPNRRITAYLGYREESYCEADFRKYADEVHAKLGGFITDDVCFPGAGHTYACGPEPMLRAAHKRAQAAGASLYVSLESRMACGIGACFGCSIQTKSGNRRICKDGPVFPSGEVFYGA